MPYILRIIYKCMHTSKFIFPWLNRYITIENPLYSITILSASYGHVIFIASRSGKSSRSWYNIEGWRSVGDLLLSVYSPLFCSICLTVSMLSDEMGKRRDV